jgi:hypothetical protein
MELLKRDAETPTHPLSKRAMSFALKLQEDVESMGLLSPRERHRSHPLLSVIVSIISVGGKLASALDSMAAGFKPDPGYTVALMKRAQLPLNEALHALACVNLEHLPKDALIWVATVRSELFDLRSDVLDLMSTIRNQG